ncbi:flagellar M-ring protein [Pilimelia terevasa]|uniref:Flagellar M-ring protein n=1 Tax=Pilimelia terevasa TaxID=53372 RepID=A0A8J3BGN4_9ACTN|nr:flagellar basal-body MS-ring/collar protein FliF [Pilimelia terevasa]GGK18208.1 flagellar M-ring protein [Pilimelia terevasa]
MGDRIPAPLRRIGGTFSSFTAGQKAVTLLGIVALAVGGFFFATWASKPAMAPLFSNLSGQDASAIVENLTSTGVEYELTDGGATIMVPSDKVYDLRLQMSGEGLPAQADTGYALLDKQGITTSDFMQHIGYQRALEGELAKTIKSIDGVQAATVHLVLPEKDIFSDDEKKPTASVMVTGKSGSTLDDEQVRAVVHLVASSVEGLDPKNVTVADASGTVLSTGDGRGQTGAGGGGGDQRAKATAEFETKMNSAVTRMLESVVGTGKAMVKTTSDLDFDETETESQRYTADPAVPPLTETTKNEKYTGGGAGNGGVLGPDNIQVPNGNGGNGTYDSTEEARRNAVGVIKETRKAAPGAVRRLSVSVLLDQNAAAGVNQAQVQQLVSAAAGINAARGDTMAVTILPFSTADADTAKAEEDKAAAAEKTDQLMGYAKTGGLVLIVLILIFLAWLGNRKKSKGLTDEELAQLAEMQAALVAEADAARAIEGGPDTAAIEAGEDVNNRREEISEMVANQPEEVAVLLRSWLADRRG